MERYQRLFTEDTSRDLAKYFRSYSRESLINLAKSNDPNGTYSDEASRREGYSPLTKDELLDIFENWMDEDSYSSVAEFEQVMLGNRRK